MLPKTRQENKGWIMNREIKEITIHYPSFILFGLKPEDILEKYKKLKKKIMNRGGKSKNQMNVLKKQLTVVMAQLEASGMPVAELNEMKKEVRHLESLIKMDERIKIIRC